MWNIVSVCLDRTCVHHTYMYMNVISSKTLEKTDHEILYEVDYEALFLTGNGYTRHILQRELAFMTFNLFSYRQSPRLLTPNRHPPTPPSRTRPVKKNGSTLQRIEMLCRQAGKTVCDRVASLANLFISHHLFGVILYKRCAMKLDNNLIAIGSWAQARFHITGFVFLVSFLAYFVCSILNFIFLLFVRFFRLYIIFLYLFYLEIFALNGMDINSEVRLAKQDETEKTHLLLCEFHYRNHDYQQLGRLYMSCHTFSLVIY